jgi:U2-associated protein SR140
LATTEKESSEERKGKWKTVEDTQVRMLPVSTAVEEEDDVPGEAIDEDDIIGEPVEEDDVEGEPIDEDDIEGEPIDEDEVIGEPMDEDEAVGSEPPPPAPSEQTPAESGNKVQGDSCRAGPPRRRMRAVDMFADSDDSDKEKGA